MKTFSTSGTGNQQTLSEIESDKIPVYDSVADAEADLANLEENQIVATKDKAVGELLHTVDIVEAGNMHPVTSNAVAESKSYFTEEHLTGAKWIDGKPIYSKTVDCGYLPNNNAITKQNVLSNVDTVVSLQGMGIRPTEGQITIPYLDISEGVTYMVNLYMPYKTSVRVSTNFAAAEYYGYVTVEYTKTTD